MTKKVETHKMTKKEMTEKVLELEEQGLAWQAEREAIIAQANALQKEHSRRLMYLRLMEKFANEIDRALGQLRSDVTEVNASYEDVDTEQTGEEL
mgnify:FL=1